ncbi:transporter substrate-binding domain-containing protein [Vibrio sp. S4M6]|uniref:substrate-binding periplasmic protein n=1 Tax=Vibrio sinus TaxID=2946865 RepID=UPI002029ED1B|nr:transporter substrate-binding domain-containing protein [Vibrio sinus]MCL9781976.1 transporter substrate-binding domain-containing protein [Vibrio sinus]
MQKFTFVAGILFLLVSATIKAETLTLTSLDWPPYSGKSLPEQGASVAVVKAAVEAMGHSLKVEFYPWSRTVHLAKTDKKIAGYFPEYKFDSTDIVFSDKIGTGPLGFVENVSAPVTWSNLNDLKSYKIGVVRGYVNTTEFDAMVASGKIQADAAKSDELNLKKVATKRVQLAVIDSNVLKYLVSHTPSLKQYDKTLVMNPKLLAEKGLYIAFTNDAEGKRWKAIVDEGLSKIDVNKVMNEHLNK